MAAAKPTSISRRVAALALPVVLLPSMLWVFRASCARLGHPLGYLLGFGVYWLFWCLLVPTILLGGWRLVCDLFRPFPRLCALSWPTQALLWWPVLFPLTFVFVRRVASAGPAILLVSIALGIVIGVTEEILWRGLFLRLFPRNLWLGLIYPSLMFALWHIAPQSVLPSRMAGGVTAFVAYAFLLGITYGAAARQTGSIAWPTIAHIVHDSLGLGGYVYAAWLTRTLG